MTARNYLTVLTTLVLATMLSACGSRPTIDEDPTIKQLASRAAKIEPTVLPPLSREDVRRTYESLARSTNNKALKAIALQRLADLELENQNEKISKDVDSPSPASKPKSEVELAVLNEMKRGSAIHQYERLLKLYPEYKGNDKVLYQLGRAYELDGNLEKTLVTLTELVKKYPNQNNRDEIQFRRGEILFSFKEFVQAEEAYQDVVSVGEVSPYYERAIFKHGWSVFKQGDTRRSLKSYFAVLDRSFSGGRDLSSFSRSELELLEDTLRIVSLSFSYLKGVDSVSEFFKQNGSRTYEYYIYERLGDLYLTQGRIADATKTFFKFVEWFPGHRQSPLFMVRLIDIYKQSGHTKELLRAKADLITAYGVGTKFWEKHDKQLLVQLQPHLKKNLDDLTAYYHAKAQKTKAEKDYRVAAYWYKTYVYSFPKAPSTPGKNMLLAESLQDSGDITAAAIEFENTAYHYPLHGKSAEAGYAALLAHRKQAELLQGTAKIKQRRVAIFSGKRFVTTFPDDKRAVTVMSKAAEELLALKDYKNAVGTAHHVVSNKPTAADKLIRINWAIIAEAEFEMGMYPQAEIASLKRLNLAGKNDKDKKIYSERLAAAIYKQGERARNKGEYREAARHFLRIGKVVPNASIRPNAEYDAAASLVAVEEWTLAIPILKSFIQQHPKNKLRVGADESLALAYEKTGNWASAASAYEILYQNETDSTKKRLILWQTADYYQKAKRADDTIKIYKLYVKSYPMPFDESIEARFRLSAIYKEKGNKNARNYWLKEIIEADKEGKSTERSKYLAATAVLELSMPTYTAYRKIKLVQPLKENLKKKKKLMQESIEAYTQASNYGIEAVTTASTYRLAEIYNDFSRSLFSSERPKGLSPDELEQYDILLEEQAYPFEEKAIDIHEVNVQRAPTGVYDRWVKESFAALADLSPVRYAKLEKGALLINVID